MKRKEEQWPDFSDTFVSFKQLKASPQEICCVCLRAVRSLTEEHFFDDSRVQQTRKYCHSCHRARMALRVSLTDVEIVEKNDLLARKFESESAKLDWIHTQALYLGCWECGTNLRFSCSYPQRGSVRNIYPRYMVNRSEHRSFCKKCAAKYSTASLLCNLCKKLAVDSNQLQWIDGLKIRVCAGCIGGFVRSNAEKLRLFYAQEACQRALHAPDRFEGFIAPLGSIEQEEDTDESDRID